MQNKYSNKVGFAVGTGRCGTTFLYQLMSQEANIASSHERSVFSESFHRYAKWHSLPIDEAGFKSLKTNEIDNDLSRKAFSFEASAPISLSIELLHNTFDAKFIFMVRSPERVINSYISKDWYKETSVWEDQLKAPGFTPQALHHHHFFGRMLPKENYQQWCEMGQVGRLAWFWNTLNIEVMKLLESLPAESYKVYRLEDFDFASYQEVINFLGLESSWTEEQFNAKVASKPNTRRNIPSVADWSDKDIEDFERETAAGRKMFNYDVDIRKIRATSKPSVKEDLPKHKEIKIRVLRAIRAAKKAYFSNDEF